MDVIIDLETDLRVKVIDLDIEPFKAPENELIIYGRPFKKFLAFRPAGLLSNCVKEVTAAVCWYVNHIGTPRLQLSYKNTKPPYGWVHLSPYPLANLNIT